jgi:S1-C subfamily serine protease
MIFCQARKARLSVVALFALIASFSLAASPSGAQTAAPGASAGTGRLVFSAAILENHVPNPVLLTTFSITDSAGKLPPQMASTDVQGRLLADLPPGSYTIASVRPTTFKGRTFTWKHDFTIQAGQQTKVDLTDADSNETLSSAATLASGDDKLFQSLKNALVAVDCDFGTASGFVVDKRGLVVTNQHVANGTQWVDLRFRPGVRVQATVVAEDKDANIAVLLFNPSSVSDFGVVPLADPAQGALVVQGERVVALGSPLRSAQSVMTSGYVSSVDKEIVASDFETNPANAGGPVVNPAGQAIGVYTLLDPATPNGSSVPGIISLAKVLPLPQQAEQKLPTASLPSADPLPDVSQVPIPDQTFASAKQTNTDHYKIDKPKDFNTYLFTPIVLRFQQADYERKSSKGHDKSADSGAVEPRSFWQKYDTESTAPVVSILIEPILTETSSSKSTRSILSAITSFVLPIPVPLKKRYEYKDSFYDMQLYSGAKLIAPVRQYRVKDDMLVNDAFQSVNTTAHCGLYEYDPSAFDPSQPLTIKMRREAHLDKWDTIKVDPKIQREIWAEFAPYRDALQQSGGSSAPSPAAATASTRP